MTHLRYVIIFDERNSSEQLVNDLFYVELHFAVAEIPN